MMADLDRIYIRDLFLRCIIGLNDEEREKTQDVMINIVLYADLRRSGTTDDIADSVNYKTIKKAVIALVEKSTFRLLEKLAEEIASVCLADPRVRSVDVTVDKPGALRFAKSVAVAISREREEQ
jgi:D-erythro-7,8-dihydroneopterin triphosphate epimerase